MTRENGADASDTHGLPAPYWQSRDTSIRLFHGDCREIVAGLGDQSVSVWLTDPPYASGARRDAEKSVRGSMLRGMEDEDWFSHDAMTSWGFGWFMRSIATVVRPKLIQGAHAYVFADWRMTPTVYGLLEGTGFRVNHCLVWDKAHFGMGTYWRNQHENIIFASNGQPAPVQRRDAGSVLRFPTVGHAVREHPTEKPKEVLQQILRVALGGLVLDTFAGSGSTLSAALVMGRAAVGCEIEERYCEIAARRLDALEAQGSLFLGAS